MKKTALAICCLLLLTTFCAPQAQGQNSPPPLHDFSVDKDAKQQAHDDDALALFIEAGSGTEVKAPSSKVPSAPPLPPGQGKVEPPNQAGRAPDPVMPGDKLPLESAGQSDHSGSSPFVPPTAADATEKSSQAAVKASADPAPRWVGASDKEMPDAFLPGGASNMSQFNAESSSNWMQLEVGQVDSTYKTFQRPNSEKTGAGSASAAINNSSQEPSAGAQASSADGARPATQSPPALSEERQQIVDLFHDMVVTEKPKIQNLQEPALQSSIVNQKITQPQGANEANTAQQDGDKTAKQATSFTSSGAAADNTGKSVNKTINQTAATGEEKVAQEKIMQSVPSADQAGQDRKPDSGGSAILRAGQLLSVEQQFGAAGILPPLEPQKAKDAIPGAGVDKQKSDKKGASGGEKKVKTKEKAKDNKKSSSKNTSAKAVKRFSLTIIDETANASLGQIYASVLRQMGYTVTGVQNNPVSGGLSGQTVVFFPPGHKAQAQSLARHLPGKKMFFEAKDNPQIIIKLR